MNLNNMNKSLFVNCGKIFRGKNASVFTLKALYGFVIKILILSTVWGRLQNNSKNFLPFNTSNNNINNNGKKIRKKKN